MRRLKIALYALTVSLFLMPAIAKFEKTGENWFNVYIDGVSVGCTSSIEEAERLFKESRKDVNALSEGLTFAECSMTYEGSEVIWGKVDSPTVVKTNMIREIKSHVTEGLSGAYAVKINGYITTLKSAEDVTKLFQAAINKYDTSNKFKVSIASDSDRELPVLEPVITTYEEAKEEETTKEIQMYNAGFDADIAELMSEVKPDKELDFEDYDLGIVSMGFKDKIEVVEVFCDESETADVDDAIKELTEEVIQNEIYKVVSGDTLSGIAIKVNIPIDDIIAMNDNLEDQNSMIRPDDELIITVPKPKLAVTRTEEMYYEENYTAETEYIDNDSWYTSDKVVHQQPSDGHRKVVAMVSFENGERVNTDIIKEEVTYKPVPKIVERGTKIPPSYIKPIYGGRISSTFGYRNRPTKGASTYHKGVDWATPVGTPVYASCGGVVSKAGWGSGYGYCIYINHPDGRSTRYGHLSKVLVSAGQTVSQGQRIALSGNTGVSTGPHLHFEILIGGSQVNPLKYVGQ